MVIPRSLDLMRYARVHHVCVYLYEFNTIMNNNGLCDSVFSPNLFQIVYHNDMVVFNANAYTRRTFGSPNE